MEKEIEIPEGYEARIEGNKVIVEKKQTNDEWVRERLLSLVRVLDSLFFGGNNPSREQCLAYLEKQKEPIPIPDKFSGLKSLMLQYLYSAANRKDDTEIESDTDLWGRKILDYVWKYDGLQKEQIGKKWIYEDDYKSQLDAQYQQGLEDGRNEQKSNLELIKQTWYTEGYTDGKYKMEPMWNIKTGKGGPRYEKNEKYGQPLERKPAEWSEEDKRKLNRIYEILGYAADDKGFLTSKRIIGDKEAIELQDFLKSLRPQPHWKPSEIQMKYLDVAIAEADGHKSYNLAYGLEKLKDDLKKL